jgi:hypothetical protein
MKKTIIILMVGTLTVVSCKKSPVEPVPPPHNNTFSAQVNGNPFGPTTMSAYLTYWSPTNHLVDITATDANSDQIRLVVDEYDGVKTSFNLGNYNTEKYGTFTPKYVQYWTPQSVSKSGQFNINSFDKTTYKPNEVITGTFQFETDSVGKYSITAGQFSLLVIHY